MGGQPQSVVGSSLPLAGVSLRSACTCLGSHFWRRSRPSSRSRACECAENRRHLSAQGVMSAHEDHSHPAALPSATPGFPGWQWAHPSHAKRSTGLGPTSGEWQCLYSTLNAHIRCAALLLRVHHKAGTEVFMCLRYCALVQVPCGQEKHSIDRGECEGHQAGAIHI